MKRTIRAQTGSEAFAGVLHQDHIAILDGVETMDANDAAVVQLAKRLEFALQRWIVFSAS